MADEQKLLESLEAEARAEREQLLSEAKAEADRIRQQAQQEADRRVDDARRRGEKLGGVEVDRRVGLAHQEVDLAVLEEKHRGVAATRQDVASRLAELRKAAGYGEALKRWTEEVITGLGEGSVVHAHPDDVKAAKAVVSAAAPGLTVEDDKAIAGGVKAISADGKVVAENTFASRLTRAEERLDEIIGQALFGQEG
ncbi:V-type ATP synthase subunit E [Gemmatimonadota bacterium]